MSDFGLVLEHELQQLSNLAAEMFTGSLEGRIQFIRQVEHTRLKTEIELASLRAWLLSKDFDDNAALERYVKEAGVAVVKQRRIDINQYLKVPGVTPEG